MDVAYRHITRRRRDLAQHISAAGETAYEYVARAYARNAAAGGVHIAALRSREGDKALRAAGAVQLKFRAGERIAVLVGLEEVKPGGIVAGDEARGDIRALRGMPRDFDMTDVGVKRIALGRFRLDNAVSSGGRHLDDGPAVRAGHDGAVEALAVHKKFRAGKKPLFVVYVRLEKLEYIAALFVDKRQLHAGAAVLRAYREGLCGGAKLIARGRSRLGCGVAAERDVPDARRTRGVGDHGVQRHCGGGVGIVFCGIVHRKFRPGEPAARAVRLYDGEAAANRLVFDDDLVPAALGDGEVQRLFELYIILGSLLFDEIILPGGQLKLRAVRAVDRGVGIYHVPVRIGDVKDHARDGRAVGADLSDGGLMGDILVHAHDGQLGKLNALRQLRAARSEDIYLGIQSLAGGSNILADLVDAGGKALEAHLAVFVGDCVAHLAVGVRGGAYAHGSEHRAG